MIQQCQTILHILHNYHQTIQMGNTSKNPQTTQTPFKPKQPKRKSFNTELSESFGIDEQIKIEEIEETQCCFCFQRKTIHTRSISWEDNFLSNCSEVKSEFRWAADMIDLMKNKLKTRARFIKEILKIKEEKRQNAEETQQHSHYTPSNKQNSVLVTAEEVESFKSNLKRSVLLSFGHCPKLHLNENNRITTNMKIDVRKSRISFERYGDALRTSKIRKSSSVSISSKSNFRRSIMSFVDDTLSSVFGNERDISKESAKELENFLKLSMILEKHLNDSDCMLSRIKTTFIQYFERTYKDPIYAKQQIGDVIDNIKQFLMILREAAIDYYNLNNFAQGQIYHNILINDQENILSVVTAILFKDPTFYNLVFNAVVFLKQERQEKFRHNLDKLKGNPPQKYFVKDKYCLNSKTINYFMKNDAYKESFQSKHSSINEQAHSEIYKEPYNSCIFALNELPKSRTPISKIKAVLACSQKMSNEIQKFYEFNGIHKQKYILDADQVLSIFSYIITEARVQHLHSHLFILENFLTNNQMISITGYYLSVMNCAVEQLQNEFSIENGETEQINY